VKTVDRSTAPSGSAPSGHMQRQRSLITTTTHIALKRLVDLSPDALLVIDAHGVITHANAALAQLFGFALDQVLSQPLETLLPERIRSAHITHRSAYLAHPHTRPMGVGLDLVGRRKDGDEFPVDISLRPCAIKGQLYVIAAIRDVSAQRLLERERTELLRRLQLQSDLINLAHDAILVRDLANRILEWNTGAEALYGWSAQEAIGQVTHILFKTRFPTALSTIQTYLEREGQWEGEVIHTRPDGRTVIVESRWALVRDAEGRPSAVLEINRDITARRQMEEAESSTQATTLAQLAFLQQVMDALPNGVYVVHGHDARLVLANRAAASSWGAVWRPDQPMQEFVEQHRIRLTDAQGRSLPPEEWVTVRALRAGEPILHFQEVIHRPRGDALPVLVNVVPLKFSFWQRVGMASSAEEAHAGMPSGMTQDAGQEPLSLVIQQDVHVLKEAEYLKDEFIGLAAHELRTPVAALKGAVGTLLHQTRAGQGSPLADWQREMLQDIDMATDRLTQLTDELLDVTRLQSGQLALHQAPTNLVAVAKRIMQRVQSTTSRHQLALQIAPPSAQPGKRKASTRGATHASEPEIVASVDATRIEQVLLNLLSNAIKYSPDGGQVTITLTWRSPQKDGATNDDANDAWIEIQVRDHGIGIPHEQQSLIFGRFVRADNAREAGISGSGLGLYISRGLIEQHGGDLWFESQEGKGTTFFVTLPLTQAQVAHTTEDGARPAFG
jgi:PAS domain S-box-containing protein